MNISGVAVTAKPARIDDVRKDLLSLPGVEIPMEESDGRMVVIIDEGDDTAAGESLMKIQNIAGVLSASLVYQHIEDEDEQIRKSEDQ